MRRVVLGDNDTAGRAFVEPVNDAGTFHATDTGKTAATVMEERVDERVLEVSRRRVHNHTGRLVDDDEVVVFEEYGERDCLRLRFESARSRYLDGNPVAGTNFVAWFGRLVVDAGVVVFDELLKKGARAFRYLGLQEPVESLAAVVFGDGEHVARITGQERSARLILVRSFAYTGCVTTPFQWNTTRTLVMGILNVTPDSFSDGGAFTDLERAVTHARAMAAAGADIIDIGGESTRPGAVAVSAEEELRRVVPVIERLGGLTVSVDTRKAVVAERALAAGARIVNDVSALRFDARMVEIVRDSGAGVVLMHMQGTPETMQMEPRYDDVVAEVRDYLAERVAFAESSGIKKMQIAVDPGIGFGKTVEHNLALLSGLEEFVALGCPVLVGASRKAFIGKLLGRESRERLAGSVAVAAWSVAQGARIVRVHDVAETVDAVRMVEAIQLQTRQ